MKYYGIEYRKSFDCLTDTVVSVLAEGKFPTEDAERWARYCEDTYGGDRVLACIEFPALDIELEAYTAEGDEPNTATNEDNGIMLTYAVCVKTKRIYGWELDGCAGRCNVDFSSSDWETLLEEDMLKTLDEYATKRGYSFTELN